eukprot:3152768-Rhodomonas_salina.2
MRGPVLSSGIVLAGTPTLEEAKAIAEKEEEREGEDEQGKEGAKEGKATSRSSYSSLASQAIDMVWSHPRPCTFRV